MSASFLLATEDSELITAWQAQLPAEATTLTLDEVSGYPQLPSGLPIVVILDALVGDRLPEALARSPLLVVGKPHSGLYEQLRMSGRALRCMDYEESRTRLEEFAPLFAEIAERRAALDLVAENNRRTQNSRPPIPVAPANNNADMWDFLEGAVESMNSKERLLAEFRRASRHVLNASHIVFFLREEGEFRADRGSSQCPVSDPLIRYLSSRPVVLDGNEWPGPPDPVAEMAARNRMALWGARLLVPLHDNGHLTGIIACGVRNDGQAYDENDKTQAVSFARLLREFLRQNQQSTRLNRIYESTLMGDRYFPRTLLLKPGEEPTAEVPVAVRALIGRVRLQKISRRLRPRPGQPFRASAGIVGETGGVWAYWENAGSDIEDIRQDLRRKRLALLRDLALTLNHEVGNSLVSFSTLDSESTRQKIPSALRKTVRSDIDRLQRLNVDLVKLAEFSYASPDEFDLGEILEEVGEALKMRVEVPPDPVVMTVAGDLVQFAIESLVKTVAENQPDDAERELKVQLRSTGEGEEITALVSIQGSGLELEGILPESSPEEVPNQGRLAVFIAKEIIRLHGGKIHAGPGMEGTEILISLRQW